MSDDNNEIRSGRHCVFMMHVHLVFVTKYRRGLFTKEIVDDLRPIFATGEQSQGNFQPAYQEEELPQYREEAMGRRFVVVTQLLCRKLWRRTDCGYSQVHRAAAYAALESRAGARTASPSALTSPP